MAFPEFASTLDGSTAGLPAPNPVMLEGKALLDKARSLSSRPEDQIARACGYVGPSGRVLKKSFFRALIAAKGYKLPEATSGGGAGGGGGAGKGRQAVFRTRVHGNGNLLIGQAYTRRMGLEPGQEFRIELERDTGSILLLPLSEADKLEPSANNLDSDQPSDHDGVFNAQEPDDE